MHAYLVQCTKSHRTGEHRTLVNLGHPSLKASPKMQSDDSIFGLGEMCEERVGVKSG